MRIAVVTSTFPVATEVPFLNILTGLVARGHEVEVFAGGPRRSVRPHPSVAASGLDRHTIYTQASRNPLVRLGQAAGALLRERKRAPFLWRSISFRYGSWGVSGKSVLSAARFVGRGTFDAVYAPFGSDGRIAERLRALGAFDAPLVTSFRGYDVTALPAKRGPGHYRDLFRTGDLFLPVCHAFVPQLAALGAPAERIRVHHTGIASQRYAWRPCRTDAGDGVLRLVGASRLVEKKGLEDTLRAVHRARGAGLDVRYRHLGEGPLRPRLEALVARLGLGEVVELPGWRPPEQVVEAMGASDVAVAASVTSRVGDQEGIPNVLKEAMLIGLPVLATRHSGIPELVRDGESGLLVPEGDPAALAAAIGRLAAERARWPEMGAAGRQMVEREFDIDVLNDRFVTLLAGLCRKS